jgi:hypothetical protein
MLSTMRVFFAVACVALTCALPAASRAQSYRSHGDWIAGCDNVRRCTVLGLASESDSNGYVVVTRDAGPSASPAIMFAVHSDGKPRDRKLLVTLERPGAAPTPIGPFDAIADGFVARATIHGPITRIVLSALRDARAVSIRLVDRPTDDEWTVIPLRGAAGALRAIDAQQQHSGRVPALPSFVGRTMRAIDAPPGPHPALVTGADAICASAGDLWFALGGGMRLRGVCVEGGAYNTSYRFFIVAPGARPRAVTFDVPWRSPHDQRALTNPSLSADGLVLSGFAKGIGLGTCGEASDWAWTGRDFRLVRFAELDECRGVASDDWPVLYRARLSGGGT